MLQMLKKFVQDDQGPTAVEYGLMVGLIAVAIILTVQALGQKLNTEFTSVNNAMPVGP